MKTDSRAFWVTSCCLMSLAIAIVVSVGRTVWMDEAMLARNLFSKTFVDMVRPLDYEQSAPILYLLLAKFAVTVYSDDISIRTLSLLVATGAVYMFANHLYDIGFRRFKLILVASLLFTNNYFIRYSTEIKPYIFDLVASICIPSIVNGRNRYLMAVAVVLFPWLSNGSIFVIAASIAIFMLSSSRIQRLDLLRVGLLFVCNCSVLYWLVIRDHPYRSFMYQYWLNDGGLYEGGSFLDFVRFVYRGFHKVGQLSIGDLGPYIAVPLLLACSFFCVGSLRGKIILTQIALQMIGAITGIFPFAHRLLLGTIPLGPYCVAHLMVSFKSRRFQTVLSIICLALVSYSMLSIGMNRPNQIDSLPISLLSQVFQESGTATYVSLGASNTIKYYDEVSKLKLSTLTAYGTTQDSYRLFQESTLLGREFNFIHAHPTSADEVSRLISDFKSHGYVCTVIHQTKTSLIMKCRALR